MFYYSEIYDKIFDKKIVADRLVIITGYVGPSVVNDLANLPYGVKLFVGMYGDNVPLEIHKSLLNTSASFNNIEIFYTSKAVHSKIYVWFIKDKIVKIYIGSANFTLSGLNTPNKEVLGELLLDSFPEVNKYLKFVLDNSKPIYEKRVNKKIMKKQNTYVDEKTSKISLLSETTRGIKNLVNIQTVKGEVHAASGLNWGFSKALPKPNDAYIKITTEAILSNPLLFPIKSEKENLPIEVIWDDGTKMKMLLQGSQKIDGKIYPKQIGSFDNMSELGVYLRNRIGKKLNKNLVLPNVSKMEFITIAKNYVDRFITREILEAYGRTDITAKLIGESTYYFDFSTK
jgi:hypothetical protein